MIKLKVHIHVITDKREYLRNTNQRKIDLILHYSHLLKYLNPNDHRYLKF